MRKLIIQFARFLLRVAGEPILTDGERFGLELFRAADRDLAQRVQYNATEKFGSTGEKDNFGGYPFFKETT